MGEIIPINPDPLPGETPEARALRLARTDPGFCDRLASNTFAYHRGLRHPAGYWECIPEEERQAWRDRLIRELEEDAARVRAERPDIRGGPILCPDCKAEMPLRINKYCDDCMDRRPTPDAAPAGEVG